jgi:hypothetical protein
LNTGICVTFAEKAGLVMQALDDYIISLPLAIRTGNRIWMSHSLPSRQHMRDFDDFIFEKVLALDDMKSNPSLHALAWDRVHSRECLEVLRRLWNVDLFITGHQPQEKGFKVVHDHLLILASDHLHGCYLPFGLDCPYTAADLAAAIRPLAELA